MLQLTVDKLAVHCPTPLSTPPTLSPIAGTGVGDADVRPVWLPRRLGDMDGGCRGRPRVSRVRAEAGHGGGEEGEEGQGAERLRALHERPRRVKGVCVGGGRLAHR